MKVIDAYPGGPFPGVVYSQNRPKCEATLSQIVAESNIRRAEHLKKDGIRWSKRREVRLEQPTLCCNFARYKVGKKWLCRKHAALLVLDNMVRKWK